jgi:hypothetical protein
MLYISHAPWADLHKCKSVSMHLHKMWGLHGKVFFGWSAMSNGRKLRHCRKCLSLHHQGHNTKWNGLFVYGTGDCLTLGTAPPLAVLSPWHWVVTSVCRCVHARARAHTHTQANLCHSLHCIQAATKGVGVPRSSNRQSYILPDLRHPLVIPSP